jgi:hypothetical protein
MSPQEIVEKFKPAIESGIIEGYKSPDEAELDRKIMYPTIVGNLHLLTLENYHNRANSNMAIERRLGTEENPDIIDQQVN